MKNKIKNYITVFLGCIVIVSGFVNQLNGIFEVNAEKNIRTIIIDPGHGGFDGGAVAGDDTYEKDLNLSIALKLKSVLSVYGYNIIMTRETDVALGSTSDSSTLKAKDLSERVRIMKEYPDAVFVSIHQNKFEQSKVRGFQTFHNGSEYSKLLAESIQNIANDTFGEETARLSKEDGRDVYILKNASIPAVIVECGFISNSEELENLKSETYQQSLAFIIANGILKYYSEKQEI